MTIMRPGTFASDSASVEDTTTSPSISAPFSGATDEPVAMMTLSAE